MKPSFVAPALPLEKSLKEQMKSGGEVTEETEEEASVASAGVTTVTPPDPKGLSISDEEKEKRLVADAEQLDTLRRRFSLSERPFLSTVFGSLECPENDYLPLFALCLIFAMQQNAGK